MFVDDCHVTSVNKGSQMEAVKRDPGNEVADLLAPVRKASKKRKQLKNREFQMLS